MKYNCVFLDGLTISQINEEYEKCLATKGSIPGDPNEIMVEHGEWVPKQEIINVEDLSEAELHHRNPEDMTSADMRRWLQSRNYPWRWLKVLQSESLGEVSEKLLVNREKVQDKYIPWSG